LNIIVIVALRERKLLSNIVYVNRMLSFLLVFVVVGRGDMICCSCLICMISTTTTTVCSTGWF